MRHQKAGFRCAGALRELESLFWAAGKTNSRSGNIKSGLNGAARPPYGLILFENGATGPRMLLEALNGQKPFKKTPKATIFMIFGLGGSLLGLPCAMLPYSPGLDSLFPRAETVACLAASHWRCCQTLTPLSGTDAAVSSNSAVSINAAVRLNAWASY